MPLRRFEVEGCGACGGKHKDIDFWIEYDEGEGPLWAICPETLRVFWMNIIHEVWHAMAGF